VEVDEPDFLSPRKRKAQGEIGHPPRAFRSADEPRRCLPHYQIPPTTPSFKGRSLTSSGRGDWKTVKADPGLLRAAPWGMVLFSFGETGSPSPLMVRGLGQSPGAPKAPIALAIRRALTRPGVGRVRALPLLHLILLRTSVARPQNPSVRTPLHGAKKLKRPSRSGESTAQRCDGACAVIRCP